MVTAPHLIDEQPAAVKGRRQHRMSQEESRREPIDVTSQSQALFCSLGVIEANAYTRLPLPQTPLSGLYPTVTISFQQPVYEIITAINSVPNLQMRRPQCKRSSNLPLRAMPGLQSRCPAPESVLNTLHHSASFSPKQCRLPTHFQRTSPCLFNAKTSGTLSISVSLSILFLLPLRHFRIP